MDIIKDLDLGWFWRGYTCGANSRKKLVESPNKITNLGKQGIKATLTDKQKVSFFIGVKMGRGKIVQNFDVVRVIQYQDKNGSKLRLTAGLGSKECYRGDTISIPFYIANNSVDNRGYNGFQYKMKYNPQHLQFNSITQSSSWTSSFEYQHDAESGVMLVQGLRDAVGYEDMVFGYLSFTVLDEAPSKTYVYMQGPSGKGTATDLLTLINGEQYYIQPLALENGEIVVLGEGEEPDPTEPPPGADIITIPPIGTVEDPIGPSTDFTYDFELDLIPIGGGGSGANLIIQITLGDGTTTQVSIPLEDGLNHYSGKIPLQLPSISTGPIIIEMWVEPEDENDIYYWFIKAGALWGFETTIPREDVNQLPITIPKVTFFDGFRIIDRFRISFEGGEDPPIVVDKVVIGEIMQIFDEFESALIDMVESTELSDLGITDGFRISYEGV